VRLLFISKIITNAGWGFETFLNDALRQSGIETICLDYQKHRYGLAKQLLALDEDFDALLLERGTGYRIPASILRAIRLPRIFLFTELVNRHPQQQYLLREDLFDFVFLRSLSCIDTVRAHGWLQPDQVGLFLSAIQPQLYHPIAAVEEDIDILFVGSLTPRRKQLLANLQRSFPVTVATVFAGEMAAMVNRAKIILNLHAEDHLDTETRVYETLACGGFLITEPLARESPFTSGVHLVEAATPAALEQEIAYYLAHPDERRAIAEAGRAKVVAEHTLTERVRQLQAVFDRFIPQAPAPTTPLDRALLRRAVFTEEMMHTRDRALSMAARLKRAAKRK
jgi:hypothetical protein